MAKGIIVYDFGTTKLSLSHSHLSQGLNQLRDVIMRHGIFGFLPQHLVRIFRPVFHETVDCSICFPLAGALRREEWRSLQRIPIAWAVSPFVAFPRLLFHTLPRSYEATINKSMLWRISPYSFKFIWRYKELNSFGQ